MPGPADRPRGSLRDALRAQAMARAGLTLPTALERGSLRVGGLDRTFSLAPAPGGRAPLLLVLHGAGGMGLGMAALSGLHQRGPAAGFCVAFPDGWNGVWNDERDAPRLRGREGVDDVAFLDALVAHLGARGLADPAVVFLAGISNGAFLAEHAARHRRLAVAGIALVAGSATVRSRAAVPRPRAPAVVVAFAGTADPLVPYAGGPIGPLGRVVQRRGGEPGRGLAAPVDEVAADWAAADGCAPTPVVETLPCHDPCTVTRLTWSAGGRPMVVLHRVEAGGHTWPGGAQYLPERLVGPVARDLDATGVILDGFRRANR